MCCVPAATAYGRATARAPTAQRDADGMVPCFGQTALGAVGAAQPIFYMRSRVRKDLTEANATLDRFDDIAW